MLDIQIFKDISRYLMEYCSYGNSIRNILNGKIKFTIISASIN